MSAQTDKARNEWRGVFPALPTQLHADFSIDFDATMRHVNQMIDAGVHGMVMMGTIGENNALLAEEKRELLKATVAAVRGRVPVLTGVSEFTTANACRYAADAAKIGADGIMLMPAMAYKADAREAMAYYRTVAGATPLPIIVYNNPKGYIWDLTPDCMRELSDVENLVVVKEASGDPRRITDLINVCGDRYVIFAGLDDILLESVMLGAVGCVFGLVAGFPEETMRMWDLAVAGKWDEAREIYRWFMPLLHLDDHPKLVHYTKLVAQECGYGHERLRPPRLPLVGEERARVLDIIHTAIKTRPVGPAIAVR
jgi:dihydrodipicolinate synthase/N-acetylneuraminate lyase